MSFTIKSIPGDYYSAHGDAIFVVHDTRTADDTYIDFKYVCDIFINGGSTAATTVRATPQPGTGFGVFNIGDVLRNYVTAVFAPAADSIAAQETGSGEFFSSVVCKFYVTFILDNVYTPDPDISGTYLASTGDSPLGPVTFFNHYNGRLIGVTTNLASFTDKVVTNRPLQNFINTGDAYCFLSYFPTGTSDVAIQVKAYAGGTLQGAYNGTITPSAAFNLQILNIAPNAVNAASTGLIDADTTHYTVQVNSGAIYTFTLTCEAVHTPYTLHFLNQYGGFESRNFTKLSRKAINITKTNFGRLPYTINSSDGTPQYYNSTTKVYNETRSTYASQYTEKMTLNTDIITDEEYTWLADLVLSPLVYMEMGGYFIPIAITATNYEYRKRINDKLTNLQLDIEFGDQFNAQYR